MINVNLFTYSTCEEIMNYKIDYNIRELYSLETFDNKNIHFTTDSIKLNLNIGDLHFGTKPTDDLDNSIKIFSALKDLDLVQANDKRLWVTLTHTLFFGYVKKRWNIKSDSSNGVIKDRFHFEGTGLRARNQNSIARLWWGARITYDEKRPDPFELTRLLWEKQDFYQNLIDRKFSTYNGVLLGFLNFYAKNKNLDLKSEMRKLFKGVNAFGGVRILSLMQEIEIKNQINSLCKFYKIDANTV